MFDSGAEDAVGVEADRAAERDRFQVGVVDVAVLGQAVRAFGAFRAGFTWGAFFAGCPVDAVDSRFTFDPRFTFGSLLARRAVGARFAVHARGAGRAVGPWRSFRAGCADFTLDSLQALGANFSVFPVGARLAFWSLCPGRSCWSLRSGGAGLALETP